MSAQILYSESQQREIDQRHLESWLAQCQDGLVPSLEYVWHTALKVGRRTPDGGEDPGTQPENASTRVFTTTMIDGVDSELQALHSILQILNHMLPVEKFDGEMPELAQKNVIARRRLARYLAERMG